MTYQNCGRGAVETMKKGQEVKFETVFKDVGDYTAHEVNGRVGKIKRVIRKPDSFHQEEALPIFVVQFSDGKEIEAFSEELRLR